MIRAALSGALDAVEYSRDPIFNLEVPGSCPDVPSTVLHPRTTWPDQSAYDITAAKLAGMFRENFQKFEAEVSAAVKAAGPAAV
jgi:phosphoenolpyruvate carboxykinase (ATP)